VRSLREMAVESFPRLRLSREGVRAGRLRVLSILRHSSSMVKSIDEEWHRNLSTQSLLAPTPPWGYVAGTNSTAISKRGGGLQYPYPPIIMRAPSKRCNYNQFPGYVFPEKGWGLDDFGYWDFYVILLQWLNPILYSLLMVRDFHIFNVAGPKNPSVISHSSLLETFVDISMIYRYVTEAKWNFVDCSSSNNFFCCN